MMMTTSPCACFMAILTVLQISSVSTTPKTVAKQICRISPVIVFMFMESCAVLFLIKRRITIDTNRMKYSKPFQMHVNHSAALPVETTTAEDQFTEVTDDKISITHSRIFKAMVKTLIGTDEDRTTEKHTSGEFAGEFDSDTHVKRVVRAANSQGPMESECALTDSQLETLNDAFSRLTEGHGMMVHKTGNPIEFGAVVRPAETPDAGQSTCPYTMSSVDLGENVYPSRLMNATCECSDCQNGDDPNLPKTTACQPLFYHVPIIRYQTVRIQTAQCVIRDFTVEFVKIATGCTCVRLAWPMWISCSRRTLSCPLNSWLFTLCCIHFPHTVISLQFA